MQDVRYELYFGNKGQRAGTSILWLVEQTPPGYDGGPSQPGGVRNMSQEV